MVHAYSIWMTLQFVRNVIHYKNILFYQEFIILINIMKTSMFNCGTGIPLVLIVLENINSFKAKKRSY